MESRLRSNYFSIVKFVSLTALVCTCVMLLPGTLLRKAWLFLTGAVFVFCTVMLETGNSARRKIWLAAEGMAVFLSALLSSFSGIIFAGIFWLDIIGKKDTRYYALCWLPVLFAERTGEDTGFCFLLMTLFMLVYWQQNKVILWYSAIIEQNTQNESKMKMEIERTGIIHREQIQKNRLQSENALLEEKARITQALHDKLGHSINGSLYKLEAAKMLINCSPQQSETVLQEVINKLRDSMNEIRLIIRNERPNKARSCENTLRSLCAECEEQYGIATELSIEPNGQEIPEALWDVILDNAFEAVTNSLKHSACSRISIRISVPGDAVRCTISDNGRGAENIVDGMGIQGMKQRVRAVHGFFDIDACKGFTINMILPIKRGESAV